MKFVRWFLGRLILTLDFIFTPRSKKHSSEIQQKLDEQTHRFKLYQFAACPFCVKVRRAIKREGLNIETRDAKNNPAFRRELEEQGGKIKVPCLRIEEQGKVTWLYESSDIVSFLQSLNKSV